MNSDQMLSQLQRDYGSADFAGNWIAQDWCYYDKVNYATAGRNEYIFFSVPAGGVDPYLTATKSTEDTNLITQNQIGGNECFIVTQLEMDIRNLPKARQLGTAVATDDSFSARQLLFARFFKKLSGMGVLTWTINQKQWMIQDSPFLTFPPGFGLAENVWPPNVGYTDGDPAAINSGANAYVALSQYDIDGGANGDVFSLGQPVFLSPSTQFQLVLNSVVGNFPASTSLYGASNNQVANLQLMCVLRGWKVRPRQ